METPSSTKRVTRSQTLAASALNNNSSSVPVSRKFEDSEKGLSKSQRKGGNQQQDRSALIDITNDSPIVGVAMGNLETPSSAIAKQRSNRIKNNNNSIRTPGSGEALLRGQVKTLLQKVEEEADVTKISLENRPFLNLQGFINSPMGLLLAPTPANTPQVDNLSEEDGRINNNNGSASFTPLPVIEEQLKICQVVSEIFDGKKQESLETQKSLTRSLLLDFSEKSEVTDASSECSSVISSESKCKSESSPLKDDDSVSNWSIQVNTSVHEEEEEEEYNYDEHFDDYGEEDGDYYYYDEEEDEGLLDELCEGIGKISVSENETKEVVSCRGKHTRFVYNSDDEIVEEEQVFHLKGLPTPKGKHLRFPVGQEEEED